MPRIPALVMLMSLTTGCATPVSFKPGLPVEVEPTLLGQDYKQGGQLVRRSGLVDGLEAVEPARADVEASQSAYWTGALLVPPGAIAVGLGAVGVAQGSRQGWAVLGLGSALLGLSTWSAVVADRHLEAAVVIYNAQLAARPGASVEPFVAPAAGHRTGGGVQGGMVLRFQAWN